MTGSQPPAGRNTDQYQQSRSTGIQGQARSPRANPRPPTQDYGEYRIRTTPHSTQRRGLLPWIRWRFSLLLPIAVILVVATAVWSSQSQRALVTLAFAEDGTGGALQTTTVTIDGSVYNIRPDGTLVIPRTTNGEPVTIVASGYASQDVDLEQATGSSLAIAMLPASVTGTLLDARTGNPVSGAAVDLVAQDGVQLTATVTGEDGGFAFSRVPAGAVLHVSSEGHESHQEPVGERVIVDVSLEPIVAEGVVLDAGGDPIQGAVVRSGSDFTVTGADGVFELDGVSDGAQVRVTASGYGAVEATVAEGRVDLPSMERQMIRAVYANVNLLSTDGGLESLIEIANTTEINAIVIDVKEGAIFFDSEVEFFKDVGTVRPIFDIEELISTLKEYDIYAIARMVVFQDPIVAKQRPDLAVLDTGGGLWLNEQGVAWVSAFNEELWDANIELATELIDRGFDEVQYDYVRFPSDGDLSTADFGREYTAEAREGAITEFMRRSHEAIRGAGGVLAADLFGFVTLMDDEQYIGQRYTALEPHLDYICMMIYPSHFEEGNIASADGHPNDFPYETIYESLQRAANLTPGAELKFRPWLQDFTYWGMREYTAEDVRAQIDAAEDFGTSGWMLWGDPFNVTIEALAPDDGG